LLKEIELVEESEEIFLMELEMHSLSSVMLDDAFLEAGKDYFPFPYLLGSKST
jgi:hypothetical protein